jgi:PAS domain-containing protein
MPTLVRKSDKQKDAESEVEGFEEKLGPFVVAAEKIRMAMVFLDAKKPDNPIIFANDSFLTLTGYDREEVLGQSFNFLIVDGTDAEAFARIIVESEGRLARRKGPPCRGLWNKRGPGSFHVGCNR